MKIAIRYLAIALASLGLMATAAAAAPATKLDSAPSANLALQQVHGFHHHCAWGPVRYHRHVPGYGNVSCARPYYRAPRVYYAPPRRYYRRYVAPRRYRAPRRRHW